MKAYKGFNPDMTCRDYQYEEGQTYETERADVCNCGFHACEYPLDCFKFYTPSTSVFHEVEIDGDMSKDYDGTTKIASTKIKIGARLSIAEIVKAAIEYTFRHIKKTAKSNEDYGCVQSTGDRGAASATGNRGAASATGYKGAASATGDRGAASATGNRGAASATGDNGAASAAGVSSAASATGNRGAASATGDSGAASATGVSSAASATGYRCAASATGDSGAASATDVSSAASATGNRGAASATGYSGAASAGNPTAVAVAWGIYGKAKGVKGSYIVLADWTYSVLTQKYVFNGAKMVRIDGEKYKADTWYMIKDGEIKEG